MIHLSFYLNVCRLETALTNKIDIQACVIKGLTASTLFSGAFRPLTYQVRILSIPRLPCWICHIQVFNG
jgi:hypothetical protein